MAHITQQRHNREHERRASHANETLATIAALEIRRAALLRQIEEATPYERHILWQRSDQIEARIAELTEIGGDIAAETRARALIGRVGR